MKRFVTLLVAGVVMSVTAASVRADCGRQATVFVQPLAALAPQQAYGRSESLAILGLFAQPAVAGLSLAPAATATAPSTVTIQRRGFFRLRRRRIIIR